VPDSRFRLRGFFLVAAAVGVLGLRSRAAMATTAEAVVVLDVLPDATEIDGDSLRAGVASELAMRVVAPGGELPGAAQGTLTVAIRHETSQLVVEYRPRDGNKLTRQVPLPTESAALQQTVVFLAGNMVRDQSQGLLRDLKGEAVAPALAANGEAPQSEERLPPSPPEAERRRFWIGVGAEAAITWVPASSDACGPSTGFYCDGQDSQLTVLQGATVASGIAFASSRFALSFGYALTDNWLLGGRFGLAVSRYPGNAAASQGKVWGPTHLEALATSVFGERALARSGVRLAVTVGAGVAEWDTKTAVTVLAAGNPPSRLPLDAWRVQAGPFLSLAVGPRIALGERTAIVINAGKITVLAGVISTTGVALFFTPELGVEVGF
jgi:hypothetical protein